MGLSIHYATLDWQSFDSISIRKVLEKIPIDKICGLVACGSSDEEYHSQLAKIKSTLYALLGRKVPVTLIPQRILPDNSLALEFYTLEDDTAIRFGEMDGVCYGHIESTAESLLFIEGIPSHDFTENVHQQSDEVFAKLNNILSVFDFEVDDIVRQWNYIGNIVSFRNGKQNYQEFNDARSRYYANGSWNNGYPAATGIGTDGEGIIVGGIAFRRADENGVYPIDNPLQVAAHVYSKSVLVDEAANAVKSTPKFERAKLIESESGVCCFVSGTAAIRGEQSCKGSTAAEQTLMTIENIDHLVSQENLVRYGCKAYRLEYRKLHVYIKHAEDYAEVRSVVEQRYPNLNLPVIYSVADVCRDELLVEIEAILTL